MHNDINLEKKDNCPIQKNIAGTHAYHHFFWLKNGRSLRPVTF